MAQLGGGVAMGMKEIGARIGRCKTIGKAIPRLHRQLRHIGHAVHRVGTAHAMPMNGGMLLQAVGQGDIQPLAEAHPVHRERRFAIEPRRCRSGIVAKPECVFGCVERGGNPADAYFRQTPGRRP